MVRWWGIAVACCAAHAAQAQYVAPPDVQPPADVLPGQLPEAPELKPPPSPIVSVRNRASLAACKKLGGVQAVAPVAGQTGLPAYELVLVELKEKALDAGGTHLLLIATTSGTLEAKGTGEAYQCPPGRGPAPVQPKH